MSWTELYTVWTEQTIQLGLGRLCSKHSTEASFCNLSIGTYNSHVFTVLCAPQSVPVLVNGWVMFLILCTMHTGSKNNEINWQNSSLDRRAFLNSFVFILK